MIFNVTNAVGAISGDPMVKVYDSTGKLKGFVGPGGGTVTSVGLSMPSGFTVTNSPVTGAGVLTVTGNGTALDYIDGTGAIQTFPTIPTVTPAALTKTDDTNVTLILGGTPTTALLQATSLTLGWTGTLATSRGGTGLGTIGTDGQLIRVNTGATALEYFTPTYLTAVPNLQAVLIAGSTLTQNNTVLGANFNFTWSGFNRFSIETDEFTSIDSTSGSNTAVISANSIGVAPYIDLNVKNGTDVVGIYLDTDEIDLYTPAIDNATANVGDVFTLVNAASGKGEWQTPSAGGGLPYGIASGTNNYTVTIPGVTGYVDGDAYIIKFTNGNDADSDIDINGLGVKTLVKEFNVQLTGGDIVSGQDLIIIYDGTNFQTLGVAPNQLFAYVTNDDSVTINKGQPVYAFGAAGNRMSVKLAYNTTDATSAQTVGLVFSTSIAPNQRGFIICQGVLSGVNTAAYSPGDQLYLGATAGTLTATKPYAPNHLVYVGIVERANAGNGQIYVKPQNGYELDELHNVQAQSPTVNDVLYFFGGSPGQWKTASISSVLGYTPVPTTRSLTIDGVSYDLSADRSWTTGGNYNAYTVKANNTAASAAPADFTFKELGEQAFTGTLTWTGTTAPSGTTNLRYRWQQLGNIVWFTFNFNYGTAGSGLTAATWDLPTDMPVPTAITGLNAASNFSYRYSSLVGTSTAGFTLLPGSTFSGGLRKNSANTGWEFVFQGTGTTVKMISVTNIYFTN
jgi:hypothetical protein